MQLSVVRPKASTRYARALSYSLNSLL